MLLNYLIYLPIAVVTTRLPWMSHRVSKTKLSVTFQHTVSKQIHWVLWIERLIWLPWSLSAISSLAHPLSPPSHSFPWKCQRESLFAVIRERATFNQPLSQMSPNTLFICGLTCEKHTARGIYWRAQHEASFKPASIKPLRTLYTQLISSSAKHNNLRGFFCTVEVFAQGWTFHVPRGPHEKPALLWRAASISL